MRLSTKGRFAVMAMIDVALRGKSGPVRLNDIASRQHISLSYLEQMFSKLRLRGLVTSVRGPGGGYSLGGKIDGITVADILSAVEDEPVKVTPQETSSAQEMTQDLWDAMNAKVLNFTQSVTLRSLVLAQLSVGGQIEQNRPAPTRGVFKKPVQQFNFPSGPNSVFALGQTSGTHG
jgi:Rrf2 family transcriptional regulator, iron-sulfur cluster assembly transcription factor